MAQILSTTLVVWVYLTALSLLLFRNWRVNVVGLVLQYVGVFGLVSLSWPLEIAVVKLVAGWLSTGILGIALVEQSEEDQAPPLSLAGKVFRALVAVMVGLVVITVLPNALTWFLGAPRAQIAGGSFLLALGLLHLGLASAPVQVVVGLLTLTSGFEVLYASVEASVLITSLLAVLNLGLSFVGAYLITVPSLEVSS
jgi:hypothetical protein